MKKTTIVVSIFCFLFLSSIIIGCGAVYEYDNESYEAAHAFTIDGAAGGGISIAIGSIEELASDIYKCKERFDRNYGEGAHDDPYNRTNWKSEIFWELNSMKVESGAYNLKKYVINQEQFDSTFFFIYEFGKEPQSIDLTD
ncbi:MAG TPA: hypothetical protein PKV16_03960 [Caldisericia bacterium]|nr:hypothetical protein [Caldisericia bacterium]HPF48465.1 hypothetical protein [Caldisericia bacterium]HPI83355.1 hypothetical protein [Caldisericia bacterium]HPQ92919.1 hypothetical protein [Caldisericia bacterium]HRV73983.1 hypothetical protein [Caldisericia bacterium]